MPEHRAEAAHVVRSPVEMIAITPSVGENRLVSDLHGELVGSLGMAAKAQVHPQLTDLAITAQKAVIDGF
ncbi:hypothetical protein RLO149_c037070 [Roseobacter litoralis Och 149]|uniref:Uncharacterized protein n=1 Tax=Roseobacter litoralis (strain ATCC 49566 / DSM 6996 / JCM 21268 / NBRC 15278 / OCh 149) TaxID=391595 RepID=F7ZBP0_ROSLO|nr:hypothetical protein RLO149_c037070 [Roseobacter litoralis Och 149]